MLLDPFHWKIRFQGVAQLVPKKTTRIKIIYAIENIMLKIEAYSKSFVLDKSKLKAYPIESVLQSQPILINIYFMSRVSFLIEYFICDPFSIVECQNFKEKGGLAENVRDRYEICLKKLNLTDTGLHAYDMAIKESACRIGRLKEYEDMLDIKCLSYIVFKRLYICAEEISITYNQMKEQTNLNKLIPEFNQEPQLTSTGHPTHVVPTNVVQLNTENFAEFLRLFQASRLVPGKLNTKTGEVQLLQKI